jgi:anti-anti-sigma factor
MKDNLLKIKILNYTPQKLELSLHSEQNDYIDMDFDFLSTPLIETQFIDILSNYKTQLPNYASLSLKQVKFIDSEGLLACVRIYDLFKKKECKLIFTDLHSDIFRLFKITKLDEKVEISHV